MPCEVNKTRLTLLIALLFSALCAGVFRTPPILFMAALLISAPFVSWVLSRWGSRALRVSQSLPSSGMAGEVVTGRVTVSNIGRVPAFLVNVRAGSAMLGAKRVLARAPVEPLHSEHAAPILRGKTSASWSQQWVLRKRGAHLVGGARGGAFDPLGISRRLPKLSDAHEILVVPRPLKLEKLGFYGGAGFEQRAPQHAALALDAMDFHGVRAWQPGEAIRRAHWKYTARTGQLHVIEWEEEPATDLAIFLDVHAASIAKRSTSNGLSGDDGDDDILSDTLEAGVVAAASIACYLLENSCRVELYFFAPGQRKSDLPARLQKHAAHSIAGREKILRALAEVAPVEAAGAELSALIEAARPLIAPGMSALAITSSRASLPARTPQNASPRAARVHAFVVDADSFMDAPPTPVAENSDDGARVFARPRGGTYSRRAFGWKRGQSLAAALEGSA